MYDTTADRIETGARAPRPERRTAREAQLGVAELVLIASCGEAIRRGDWATIRGHATPGGDAGRGLPARR